MGPPAFPTLPPGTRCHFSPAAALVTAPVVPQACLPLILLQSVLISLTRLRPGLLPCPGQCTLALLPPGAPWPAASSHGNVAVGEMMTSCLAATCLGNEAQLLLPPDTFHLTACSVRSSTRSVAQTCWSSPRTGIKACLDFQHTQVVNSFLLASSSLCSQEWLLKFLILPQYCAF